MSSLDTEVVGGTAAEGDGDKSTKSEPQALFQATFKLGEVGARRNTTHTKARNRHMCTCNTSTGVRTDMHSH